jgi:hypothetical protein
MTRWKVVDTLFFDIPEVAACYVIYADGKVIYVGSTENLASRLPHHLRFRRYTSWVDTPWGTFRDVTVKYYPSVQYGDWAMIELRLIRKLQPPGNTRGIRNPERTPKRRRAASA